MGQPLPDDWEQKTLDFRHFVLRRKLELKVTADNVFNMDEVPMTFDSPNARTVDQTGVNTVPITTTGHEKTHFTVVLCCSESGEKVKPMVIFKRLTMPKEEFPDGIVVHVQKKGWVDTPGMHIWAEKAWQLRPVNFFNKTSLLIWDSFSAHLNDDVRKMLKREHSTTTAVIPGGLTKLLQPLDIAVNRSFKAKIREYAEKWMTEGLHTFTISGKMRRVSHAEVCRWVMQAWDAIPVETIKNGFRKARILGNGNENNTDSEAEEANDTEDENLDFERAPEIIAMFNSDTEEEDFDGFSTSESDSESH